MSVLAVRPRLALKTIVVVTDFSSMSELALQQALAIARHYDSKIHLVHALASGSSSASDVREVASEAAAAERNLGRQAEECADVRCSHWLLTGTVLTVVERLLSFDNVDL